MATAGSEWTYDADHRRATRQALDRMISYGHSWTDPKDNEVREHAQTTALVRALLAVADEIKAARESWEAAIARGGD